jgi:hypothetical protein
MPVFMEFVCTQLSFSRLVFLRGKFVALTGGFYWCDRETVCARTGLARQEIAIEIDTEF